MSDRQNTPCEITHNGKRPPAVGLFQVYDDTIGGTPMATMSRPAWMCEKCVALAKKYGMRPEKVTP